MGSLRSPFCSAESPTTCGHWTPEGYLVKPKSVFANGLLVSLPVTIRMFWLYLATMDLQSDPYIDWAYSLCSSEIHDPHLMISVVGNALTPTKPIIVMQLIIKIIVLCFILYWVLFHTLSLSISPWLCLSFPHWCKNICSFQFAGRLQTLVNTFFTHYNWIYCKNQRWMVLEKLFKKEKK